MQNLRLFGAAGLLFLLLAAGCTGSMTDPGAGSDLHFTSTPVTQTLHNDLYSYIVSAEGGSDSLVYLAAAKPDWASDCWKKPPLMAFLPWS